MSTVLGTGQVVLSIEARRCHVTQFSVFKSKRGPNQRQGKSKW